MSSVSDSDEDNTIIDEVIPDRMAVLYYGGNVCEISRFNHMNCRYKMKTINTEIGALLNTYNESIIAILDTSILDLVRREIHHYPLYADYYVNLYIYFSGLKISHIIELRFLL